MSTPQMALSAARTNLALATLFSGMFVLGSAELLVVGVLDLIAANLHVSIPAAGTLVTVYALGLAIGGPILTALTIRLNKRTVLVGTLVLFIMGNLVAVLTTSYGVFLAARVFTGALQGLFIAAAFAAGIAVVPPERIGRAIALIVSGVAVSAALGVPLGTLVGQALGWRGSFTAIVVLAVITLIATLALVPSTPSIGESAGNQAKYAFAPRVIAVLVLNFLVFAALYAAFTYIVPFLQSVTGVSGALLSVFLLAYGVATAAGSFGGGKFADQNAARTLVVASVGVAVCLLALYFVGTVPFLVALVMLAWGLFAFGMVPSLQYRVISLAGPGGALAQSLPASAANVGIAVGSFAGGVAVGSFTAAAAVITGLVIAVLTIPVAWATSFLKPPVVDETTQPAQAGTGG
ncbi:MFS transporter [Kibdelosporangium aridum]|uniref:MFS transporter, DHA1 family, arabinose polymer transporter n=1 Tax=Kibdelosporangium aridum TaxID=2030 RepID=A0A1W2FTV0_KIBAR|nr:MFS transporter [Kibdelosporangium aridum]SMD25345.1 MFS transporter, DHA1 family, arabinose polymer transporter [Kibdelosporangium aridum]